MENSECQDLAKEWVNMFKKIEQLQDRQLKALEIVKNPSIQGYVKDSLWQSILLRGLAIESCKGYIDFLNEHMKTTIASTKSENFSESSLPEVSSSVFSNLSASSSEDSASLSSMTDTKTSDLDCLDHRTLSETTEETISDTTLLPSSPVQSIESLNSEVNLAVTKLQSRFRGGLIRNNLSQIQSEILYKKSLEEQRTKSLALKVEDAANSNQQRNKNGTLQQGHARLKFQKKQKNAIPIIKNENHEDDQILAQAAIISSYEQAQSFSLRELSKEDKKKLVPLQKALQKNLFSFDDSMNHDQNIAHVLYPIIAQGLRESGVDNVSFSNWIVRNSVRAAHDSFNTCLQDCGQKYNGPKIYEKIIIPTFGEDRVAQLRNLNRDKNLQFSDEQIGQVIQVEKQLLLTLSTLQYKKIKV